MQNLIKTSSYNIDYCTVSVTMVPISIFFWNVKNLVTLPYQYLSHWYISEIIHVLLNCKTCTCATVIAQ